MLSNTRAVEDPATLKHHFETPQQQYEASTLGMWAFLLTEVMFFGGLFAAYTVYRNIYWEAYASTTRYMNITLGAFNTVVLIASSLTMALAVRAAKLRRQKAIVIFLLATIFLGCIFLGVKAVEYHEKWVEHHIPGASFHYEQQAYTQQAQILFFLYFAMTGMHALHMVIGVGLLTTLVWMSVKGRFNGGWFTPVEMGGLYWHFVDIVWIFLFPLLYLIGPHR